MALRLSFVFLGGQLCFCLMSCHDNEKLRCLNFSLTAMHASIFVLLSFHPLEKYMYYFAMTCVITLLDIFFARTLIHDKMLLLSPNIAPASCNMLAQILPRTHSPHCLIFYLTRVYPSFGRHSCTKSRSVIV